VENGYITFENVTTIVDQFTQVFEKPLPDGDYTLSIKVKRLINNASVSFGLSDGSSVEGVALGDNGIYYATITGAITKVNINIARDSTLEVE
jgi:hypothetical protein